MPWQKVAAGVAARARETVLIRSVECEENRGEGGYRGVKSEKRRISLRSRVCSRRWPQRGLLSRLSCVNVGKKASEEGWLILRSSTSSRRGRALLMETSFDLSSPLPLFLLLSPSLGLLRSRLSPCLACKRGTTTSRTSLMRRWSLLLSVDESSFSLRGNLFNETIGVGKYIDIARKKRILEFGIMDKGQYD